MRKIKISTNEQQTLIGLLVSRQQTYLGQVLGHFADAVFDGAPGLLLGVKFGREKTILRAQLRDGVGQGFILVLEDAFALKITS